MSIYAAVLRLNRAPMKSRTLGSAAVTIYSLFFVLAYNSWGVPQAASAEDEVKAAFLFNFAKFVDWPPQSFPTSDAPFTICVAGNAFEGALERIIQGETLDKRPLLVRLVPTGNDVRACQILY